MGDMEQGSLEWHEYREGRANASEAAAVMGAGRFKPFDQRQLCMVRNGSLLIPETEPMRRGKNLEGEALKKFMGYKPLVVEASVDGIPMSASLDGANSNLDSWVEIKVCTTIKSKYWTHAVRGSIHPSIRWQMMHQWLVCRENGLKLGCLYVCMDTAPESGLALQFIPTPEEEEALIEGWKNVWPYIEKGEVIGDRTDQGWIRAAEDYKGAKADVDAAELFLGAKKKHLLELAGGAEAHGAGVSVTKVTRPGSPDYSKLPQDVTDSLPHKADTSYFAVNIAKEKTDGK